METFIQSFLKNAALHPDRTAAADSGGSYTYAELNRRSASLAEQICALCLDAGTDIRALRAAGENGARIAVLLPRTREYITAFIAAVRLGCAIVPIDTAYPKDRIRTILSDSGASLCLTVSALKDMAGDIPVLLTDDAAAFENEGDTSLDLSDNGIEGVYIYTSGSTGKPKGVVQDMAVFCSVYYSLEKLRPFDESLYTCCIAGFTFAASFIDICTPFISGGAVFIADEQERVDAGLLYGVLTSRHITSIFMPPKLYNVLYERYGELPVESVFLAGEKYKGPYHGEKNLFEVYGSSEALLILGYRVTKEDARLLGRPLEHTEVYLTDENGGLIDRPGIIGELCTSSPFVARRYNGMPERTAAAFTDCPFAHGKRMFRSGDYMEYTEDFELLFHGRRDRMVKLRGFRVELGEIESVMLGHGAVTEAACIAADTGTSEKLCCWYTGEETDPEELRRFAAVSLPHYMVPDYFVRLDAMPRNDRGKVDYPALQKLEFPTEKTEYRAPETEKERIICEAFERVLKTERVGADDDFFALGGDSIRAVELQGELSQFDLRTALLAECRTPARLAARLTEADSISYRYEERSAYPMTDAQLGIYLACLGSGEGVEYNTPSSMLFPAELEIDAQRLADAVKRTVGLYPFMKVRAEAVNGVPCFVPDADMETAVPVVKTDETDIKALCKKYTQPFDLAKGPLFRFTVFVTPVGVCLFSDMHHLITDGTSVTLFNQNLARIYAGAEPMTEQVNEFMLSTYEQELKQSDRYKQAERFFAEQLAGVETDSNLIADEFEDKPLHTGGEFVLTTGEQLTASRAERFCRDMGITENTLFLGAFAYALAKQSGQEQALFCLIENGRSDARLRRTFGMLVHTLPVCIKADDALTVGGYLAEVQQLLFGTIENDALSIVGLSEEYGVSSDILFVYQGAMLGDTDWNGTPVPFELYKTDDAMSKLSLTVFKERDGYRLQFEYDASLYLPQTVEGFAALCMNILKGLLSADKLADIALCSQKDYDFYKRVNDNEVDFDRSLTVVDLFRRQVSLHGDRTAVVFKDRQLTYSELDMYSERLAKRLTALGVGREVPVGIMVKRCELFPVCTIAVLKAGGACQPLDSNYPEDRLRYMLEDSGAPVVIADDGLVHAIDGYTGTVISASEIYSLGDDPDVTLTPPAADSLFALIYTSGSTGKPKGCMLEHRNLVNFSLSFAQRFGVTENDRFAAFGAFGFDASMQDMYPALTSGAAVYIVPEETRLDLPALHEFVIGSRITMMDCTTQLGRQYITAYPESPYMRTFTVGGEKLVPCDPPKFDFVNTYGPTECTIYITDYKVDRRCESVPIGQSFGNCDVYIVDKQLRPLPCGAVGELAVAGLPVTRGYLNRPDLTAERFPANSVLPREGYERMYLTGDICRYLAGGMIQYVGRRDEQVKIRGFRIELTEIERRIREFEGITDACVTARDLPSGGKAVVAYVVADEKIDVRALERFIGEELPPYMVPSATVQTDMIPLTPNGKVDKRKLPEPTFGTDEQEEGGARELTALEEELCAMISSITGFETRNVSAGLISAGLTSLTTIMFAAKLHERFGLSIKASELMDESCSVITVENTVIRHLLGARSAAGAAAASEAAPDDRVKLCAEQLGVYFDSVKNEGSLIYNIPMKTVLSANTDTARLKAALEDIIKANPVLTSKIIIENGEPVQVQMKDYVPEVPVLELDDGEAAAEERAFVRPFKLSNGPLFRAEIIKKKSGSVLLLTDSHHTVMDGLSVAALMEKLAEVYKTGAKPVYDASYYTYIKEAAELEHNEKGEQAKEYYKELFADYENASELPHDRSEEDTDSRTCEAVCRVDRSSAEELCRRLGITPAVLFLAASQYAVSRLTGERHVYMSMISGGREDVRFISSLGMFVKNLPLHAFIDTERTAAQFLTDTRAAFNAAQRNSAYPFIKLFDRYGFASKINYAYQVGVDEKIVIEGETACDEPMIEAVPKFPVSIYIEDDADSFIVRVICNNAFYSERAGMLLSSAIAQSARSMISDADGRLCRISMLTDEDRARLDIIGRGGRAETGIGLFHGLFEAQAAAHPDKTALIACDRTYSYRELDREMNRAANALIGLGLKKGDRAAILLPRTSRQIIAMYAVMKAGGAYIPCDPEYPAERIGYILSSSGARFIITDEPRGFGNEIYIDRLLECTDDSKPETGVSPEDTAYLIYTSGSTGRPKGVVIRHSGIANYLTPDPANIHINALAREGHVYVSVTTVSFDMSLKETAAALCSGLTLVLADEAQTKEPQLLCELFRRTGGDVFNATPSRLEQYMLLPAFREVLAGCRIIMCGGEKYSPKLLENLKAVTGARIFNTYGPTEITVSCNAKELTESSEVCVGRPLLNVNEYITDPDGNPLPIGAVGELYVGGAGVAAGYLNAPELTAKSFTEYNGERVYKTGDYARWTDGGDVMILGRTDDQVKLRGLRIELGEVEKAILSCEGVKQAAVIIGRINGAEHLCGYYSADESVDEETVLAHISKRLTQYMVPTSMIRLDEMPVTPNGKTDRRAPAPKLSQAAEFTEASNAEEKAFCDIFAKVLGLDRAGADSSFFDLGGSSLTVTSVIIEAAALGYEISYGDVFALKTPRALAAKLGRGKGAYDDFADYDYTELNRLIEGSSLSDIREENAVGNVLLTGSAGFLGIHILYELLHNTDSEVWCLLRRSRRLDVQRHLKTLLYYYFEDRIAGYEDRLHIIEGDITSDSWFGELDGVQLDTVINCAALVKHFSETDDIERVNTGGVKNLIEFCRRHGSMIVQISTGSVAGDSVNGFPGKDAFFDEHRLYIGQTIDNQYVRSKFSAERLVLEAVRDGLRGKIMRVGNLAPRAADREFQINLLSNGFMGRLRAYLAIGAFPYDMMDYMVELAPIDETAKAILRLIRTPDSCCIFHPFNNHYIPLGDIIIEMRRIGLGLELVEMEEFLKRFGKAQNDPGKAALLTTLLAYDNKDKERQFEMIKADNTFTSQALYRLGFSWPITDADYISNFLSILKGLRFFDIGGDS